MRYVLKAASNLQIIEKIGNNKRVKGDIMAYESSNFGGMFIIIIIVAFVITVMVLGSAYLNKAVDFSKKGKSSCTGKKKIKYTSKDRDMATLIHELAEVYRKKDESFKKRFLQS